MSKQAGSDWGSARSGGGLAGSAGNKVNTVYKPLRQSSGTSYGSEANAADKALGRSMDTGKGKGPQRGVARRGRIFKNDIATDDKVKNFPSLTKPAQGWKSVTKPLTTPKVPKK
jgi:hypothetical protein